MLVPCLGRSSAQGLPLAAGCPGCPQTSPGWRARYSTSPGCRRSCARGCRSLPAECSSPGCWGKAEPSTRVTPCSLRPAQGLRSLGSRHGGWGRAKRTGPEPDQGETGLPCPLMPPGAEPRVWAEAGVPTTVPTALPPLYSLSESHHLPALSLRSAGLIPPFLVS